MRAAGIEATVNKAAAGNDAAFAFKTGFSARALIGLLGSDDFSFKVSPDGSAYYDAILIDRTSGRVELPKPAILPAVSSAPAAPASGKLALYARSRAGQPWLDAMRPNGRDFSLQPHLGLARPANWLPSSGATITTEGMSNSTVGTVSTPGLAATSLATSMRRWRLTSAAVVDSASDQRSGVFTCWRGNAAGLGGWTFVTRLSLATLQATGMAFFGLYGSTAALATTLTLSAVVSCVGIGFQRGTHTRWQLVTQRCERRADADRHGRVLRHRHRRRADALHRGVAERRLGLGARGRRGERRGLRAGGHRRPAGREPVPRAAALHEQRRDGRRRRLRLLRPLPRDRFLTTPVGGQPATRPRPPSLHLIPSRRTTPMTPSHHGGSTAACRTPTSRRCWRAPPRKARRRALSDVGLGGKDAVLTIHDMRSLLECIQFVRRTAVQTAVHVITTGVLIALLTGIAMKLRWFGPNP